MIEKNCCAFLVSSSYIMDLSYYPKDNSSMSTDNWTNTGNLKINFKLTISNLNFGEGTPKLEEQITSSLCTV